MEDVPAPDEEALARAVHAVYGARPEDFVAVRKAEVARLRAAKRREVASQVAALRKPSVSAAAVNALVRADDPVVGGLRDLGARMRHAQSTLDAPALAALRPERDALLAAWVAAAREHAPAPLTPTVEAEVRDTAVAALADAAATEVATSGSLTRALSYSGFGEVDVADAVARTSTGVVLTRLEGGRAGEDAEDVEDEAAEEAEEAAAEAEPDDAEEADDAEDEDTTDVAELEMALDEAEKVVAAARAARRAALRAHERAQEAAETATARLAEVERLLAEARAVAEEAQEELDVSETGLERADEELQESRRLRDDARAALEEAEDR